MNKLILCSSTLAVIVGLISIVYAIINSDYLEIPLMLGTLSVNLGWLLIAISDEGKARHIKSVEKFIKNRHAHN